MRQLLLIGAGGHAHACIDVIEQTKQFEIIGVLDQKNHGQHVLGYPILGDDEALSRLRTHCDAAIITIGQIQSSTIRQKIFERLIELQFELPVIISPHAYVAQDATIGQGSIIMHGSIINRCATIGDNVIINTRALIEHDVAIGNHTHVATGAIVNGGATIGDHVFLGSQSVVVHQQNIPHHHFLKANQLYYDGMTQT